MPYKANGRIRQPIDRQTSYPIQFRVYENCFAEMEISAFEMEHDDNVDGFAAPRKSLSYYSVLPPEPMRLTVIKLDGSSFDVEVLETADVGELKQAVESAFSHLPKQGAEKISWRHVWGHFCLCYNDQNLLTETDYLTSFGIKDGDKLQIVRHFTPNYEMEMQRSARSRRAGSSSSDEGEEEEDTEVQSDASSGYHAYSMLPTEEDDKHKSRARSFSSIRVFYSSLRRIMMMKV